MYRACIAVVDASRARLFTYERTTDAGELHEQLTEQRDLVNPARRLPASELFSEPRPGVGRSGKLQWGFDDHRNDNIEHMDAQFSKLVTDELANLMRTNRTDRVIVCASPRMLGELRDAGSVLDHNVPFDEVPRDLVKLTPAQLRKQLTSYGLLPEPPPRAGA